MQTKTRFSLPRNRPTYTHNTRPYHVRNHWEAFNVAEYYLWSANRRKYTCGLSEKAEQKADMARAKYYLQISKELRKSKP